MFHVGRGEDRGGGPEGSSHAASARCPGVSSDLSPFVVRRPLVLCVINKEEMKPLLSTAGIDCKASLKFRDMNM